MAKFQFNDSLSPEDNITLFFEHLKHRDPEMANALISSLSNIHPLPENSAARTAGRRHFHEIILALLRKTAVNPIESK
jgi:hypothetical protein